jgi:hypothetical protein
MSLEIDVERMLPMGWTERQRAMLEEIGIRVWVPAACRRVPHRSLWVRPRSPKVPACRWPTAQRFRVPPTPMLVAHDLDRAVEVAALDAEALAARAAACTACATLRGTVAVGVRQWQPAGRLDGRR